MGKIIEAQLIGSGLKVGIVVGRFNEFITSKLLGGALDGLKRHGVDENDVDIAWVPGAFELPLIAKKLVNTGKYDAVIGLGTVIRGPLLIMIMCVMKQLKAWQQFLWTQVYLLSSVC